MRIVTAVIRDVLGVEASVVKRTRRRFAVLMGFGTESRAAVNAGLQRNIWSADPDRSWRESAHRQHPVIHHQRACYADVDTEFGRYLDYVIAAFQHFRLQLAAFRAKDIGGLCRVVKAWQFNGIVDQLDANQFAGSGQ